MTVTKLGQYPFLQEKSLLHADWLICLFLPKEVSKGSMAMQLDWLPQSPQPSQTNGLINILDYLMDGIVNKA